MKNLFGTVNIRATFVGLVVSEIILIAMLVAFDIARGGMTIIGYVLWSLVFIIFFPILLKQWSKYKKNDNENN
ncbi:MAG: hypothetical protein ACXAAM_08860 [Candidatus Heimdallarchaeaceae archaeon]|jgi:hypothetical protein